MSRHIVLAVAGLAICSSLAYAQSATEKEVTQTILDSNAYTNTNAKAPADEYAKLGALEFWSSGGLLHEVPPGGTRETFDAISVQPKHIRVITLVEGQAAVAHYYSEGSIKPKGAAAVGNYLTRVTQVFVKEDGKWKIRSSHWSAITGGSGTSQTTP